ncbi:MAG: 4Fe-4S binding protein [Treponema sp.]|nr:4Fe-4S binding protein [Treponema sp.]
MLIYNADIKRWGIGTISRSQLKQVCVPGLNCYSCPGAIASCPLGALQNTIANGRFPFFVTGFLLLTGTLLGRMVCAFLCPVGLVQELLHYIPSPKLKKTKKTFAITRPLTYIKYVLLVVFCITLPLLLFFKDGIGSPLFCSLFCPAGTLEAGVPLLLSNETLRSAAGFLFKWKLGIALLLVLASIGIYRPFCRFFCPLGAIYSFFNKTALFGIKLDEKKCTHCNSCVQHCKMDTLHVNDHECIRCGECIKHCHVGALNQYL